MRILLTADPMLPVPPAGYGGIERIVDALVRTYRTLGHVVGLVAHPESATPADRLFAWPRTPSGSPASDWRHAFALRQAAREFKPDVLHSFSRLAYLLPLFPVRRPIVMSYQRHTGGPHITWASRLGGRSLAFTGCSEFITAMGRRAGGNWTSIPNFVDPARFTFVPEVPGDAPLVFLGRVEPIKGADTAIAIARHSARRLIIAGNRGTGETERAYWEREIAPQIDGRAIEYIGEVNDGQKNTLLGRAAALVAPVRWDEPFGIVFAEALASGTPVLSCPRGALPEIVDHGRTGFLIRNVDEGVAAVRRLPTLDRHACRQAAERRFGVRTAADRYLGLYARMRRES